MSAPRVVVVGGGLAGLSAALAAADAAAEVTLLEARPRLGGATSSFPRGGLWIDNGQHVFLRCCTAYRGFLRRLGVEHLTTLQPRLDVPVLVAGEGGRAAVPARLRRTTLPLPPPLHLAPTLLRYRALPLAQRLRAGLAARALGRLDPRDPAVDGRAFGPWLAEHAQGPAATSALWELLTVATLNLPADQASLGLAATVVRTGLLERADAGDIGQASVPLQELHGDAAAAALAARGARARTGAKVTGLARAGDGWTVTTAGGPLPADAVVLAVPAPGAAALLPPGALPAPARLRDLGGSPIVNVHVVFDRPVLSEPFVAVVGSPVQWVFDRTRPSGLRGGQYLAVSLSAADEWVDVPVARLRELFVDELRRLFPAARAARVVQVLVTRERAATFRQAPGTQALRPGPRTGLP
ncbi:MAG TPA: hydroxysqualene dehydroxylase HpnE, partial [Frankiaceae bacterium]|nr:hydroxysqualene dehydroxylase HpnE [Frankiaceae bacterium]